VTPRTAGGPEERRKAGEVIHTERGDPVVDILGDDRTVYVTAEFPADVEVDVEATRVVFRGPGAPNGFFPVDLPVAVDPDHATINERNGVVDIAAPKLLPVSL